MIRRLLTFAVFAATVASPWKASALTQCQRCIEIMAPDTFECAAVCGGVFQLQLNYINMLRTLSPVQPAWLQRVNQYRGLARLASVSENTSLDPDEVAYAQHMVTTDTVAHDTSPAGQNSDLAGTSSPTATDQSFVDMWMSGPFHALGIIDPRLVTTAYGSAHDNVGAVQSAGA